MTLLTYPTVFADNSSTVTAEFLNTYIRTELPKAIDGVGGGVYTPTAPIDIDGANGIRVLASHNYRLGSRAVIRQQTLDGGPDVEANWVRVGSGYGIWSNLVALKILSIPLDLPHGQVLDSLHIRFTGGAGHPDPVDAGAGLTWPTARIYRIDSSGAGNAVSALFTCDGFPAKADYESYQTYEGGVLAALAHTIDRINFRYVLIFTSEGGANFQAGGSICQVYPIVTCTNLSEY